MPSALYNKLLPEVRREKFFRDTYWWSQIQERKETGILVSSDLAKKSAVVAFEIVLRS